MDFKILFDIFVFIFGLCIGSFLNCVIYRLESEKTLAGRSFCPHCKHTLAWYDLVPVFSYLFLFGKCRYCKKNISFQYPAVELFTAILFVLIFNYFWIPAFAGMTGKGVGMTVNLVFLLYIASVLVVIFVYDLKHYLIPDKILFPAIGVAVVFRVLEFLNFEFVSNFGFRASDFKDLFGYFLAVLVAAGFFLSIFLVSRGKWMGFGDVKLAVLMGILLGFQNVLVALFLAFFLGAIIGVMLMAFQKKGLKSEIPFGPFLILGTFLALFLGQNFIQWYLHLFLF